METLSSFSDTVNQTDEPATVKQQIFLAKLIAERPTWALGAGLSPQMLDSLNKKEASDWISTALEIQREGRLEYAPNPGALTLAELSEGSYWTLGGDVARVRRSKHGRRLYAELLDVEQGKFEYARGTIYNLASRMTFEEAKAWGARVGRCCVCAARLTDQKSVEAGIGPVCVQKI